MILTNEIERLRETAPHHKPTSDTVLAIAVLDRLRIKYSALDYAEELLTFAKEAVSWFCDNWEGYENPDIPTCGVCLPCQAQALIEKIEEK